MKNVVSVDFLENRTLLSAVPAIYGAIPTLSADRQSVNESLVTIANRDSTPAVADGTAFTFMYEGGKTSRTFVIKNTGDRSMTISAPIISGKGAAAFSIVTEPTSLTIDPGASQRFVVQFSPAKAGMYFADIVVHKAVDVWSRASDYTFEVSGVGVATQELAGGLRIATLKAGKGAPVVDGALVEMDYTGWRQNDGLVFDSSLFPNRPSFGVSLGHHALIDGREQGMLGMMQGEKRLLFIPSAMGYGQNGSGVPIPPNTDLIFSTTLLSMSLPGFRSGISFSGNGHALTSGGTSYSAADGSAFYSYPSKRPDGVVLHSFILDVGSDAPFSVFDYGFGGTDSAYFKLAAVKKLGPGKVRLTIAYTPPFTAATPTTSAIPAPRGLAMDATFWFTIDKNVDATQYSFALHGETVAANTKLSGRTLGITGTINADTFDLSQSGTVLTVTSNGVSNHFNTADLGKIQIKTGAGDDTVLAASVTVGMSVDAGDGNDSVTTGSGTDTIKAGAGNDTLIGGLGSDLLIGGKGTNAFYADDGVADTLDGGGGVNNVGKWDDGIDVLLRGTPMKLL